jgi:hypothetical protein
MVPIGVIGDLKTSRNGTFLPGCGAEKPEARRLSPEGVVFLRPEKWGMVQNQTVLGDRRQKGPIFKGCVNIIFALNFRIPRKSAPGYAGQTGL